MDITTVGYLVNQIVIVSLWTYFYGKVLPKRYNDTRDYVRSFMIIGTYTVLSLVIFNRPGTQEDNSVLRLIVDEVLFILLMVLAYRDCIKQFIRYFCIHQLLTLSGEILAILSAQLLVMCFPALKIGEGTLNITVYILNDFICWILYRIAIHRLTHQAKEPKNRYVRMILILIVSQFVWIYIVSYTLVYERIAPRYLFGIAASVQVLCALSVLILARYMQKMQREKTDAALKREADEELKQHVAYLSKKQTVLEEIYRELTDTSQTDIQSLQDAYTQLASIRNELYSDNVALNALLNYFNGQCERENVTLNIQVRGSFENKLDSYDLNTLLSNLLKNALEASNTWINLSLQSKENLIFIECRNACNRIQKENTKQISGQGMGIVKRIVKQYDGTLNFQKKNQQAQVAISLIL